MRIVDIRVDICRYTCRQVKIPAYVDICMCGYLFMYRVDQKKSGISKTMAITPLKSIRKGKSWCVSENSALMLQDMHQTFQI